MSAKIRTRFAPSPTGSLHIGSLRTALYAYALAKHNGGEFVLRIEDTDKKREVPGGKEKIKEILTKFGMDWDEYHVQSERVASGIYKKAADRLIAGGFAYEDDGAVRIKIPKGETVGYHDFVLDKDVEWKTDVLADLVLLKSDDFPTYHLAVVVDDHDMGITHVLRGHDWLPSTPIHLLLYKFLGFNAPQIGHLTDILDPAGGKLSKRKGSFSLDQLKAEGYLPEAIRNFVILLGWAPKDNREIFETLEDFVKAFDPKGFQKANPVFNREKLDWFNGYYIRKLSDESLNSKFKVQNSKFAELPEEDQLAITRLVKERINKLSDLETLAGFFFAQPQVDKSLLGENRKAHLETAADVIKNLDDWKLESLNGSLMGAVKDKGFKTGDFFMDLRIAVTGSKFTPPINDSIIILGKEEVLERLKSVSQ